MLVLLLSCCGKSQRISLENENKTILDPNDWKGELQLIYKIRFDEIQKKLPPIDSNDPFPPGQYVSDYFVKAGYPQISTAELYYLWQYSLLVIKSSESGHRQIEKIIGVKGIEFSEFPADEKKKIFGPLN